MQQCQTVEDFYGQMMRAKAVMTYLRHKAAPEVSGYELGQTISEIWGNIDTLSPSIPIDANQKMELEIFHLTSVLPMLDEQFSHGSQQKIDGRIWHEVLTPKENLAFHAFSADSASLMPVIKHARQMQKDGKVKREDARLAPFIAQQILGVFERYGSSADEYITNHTSAEPSKQNLVQLAQDLEYVGGNLKRDTTGTCPEYLKTLFIDRDPWMRYSSSWKEALDQYQTGILLMQAGAKIESGCSYFENSDRPHVWFEEGYTKLRQVQGGLAHPDSKANFAASDTSYDTVVQEVNKAISTLEAMFSKLAEGHQQGMSR